MEPAIKKVVIALAVALVLVLGLIVLSADGTKKQTIATENTASSSQHNTDVQMAENTEESTAEHTPNDEAAASNAQMTQQAQDNQTDDTAQSNEEIYEGALAGLSEEEIAQMALAEEQSAHRTEETGIETAVD